MPFTKKKVNIRQALRFGFCQKEIGRRDWETQSFKFFFEKFKTLRSIPIKIQLDE